MWLTAGMLSISAIIFYAGVRFPLGCLVSIVMTIWCLVVALFGFLYHALWFLFSKQLKGMKLELLPNDSSLMGLELFFKLDYTRPPMTSFPVVVGYMIVSLNLLLFLLIFSKSALCGPDWFGKLH
jgi:hypothetical protein